MNVGYPILYTEEAGLGDLCLSFLAVNLARKQNQKGIYLLSACKTNAIIC